ADLSYNRARYYDSQAGRFISEDPFGFSAGLNFYDYVDNNLPNTTDPTGEYIQVYGDSADWVKALLYLSKVPAARDVIQSLAKSRLTVTIIVDPSLPCDSTTGGGLHSMLTGVIRWNPHCALQCEKGGLQSPALGLF